MVEASRTIVVAVEPALAEIVTDRMWQWGVRAVGERDAGRERVEIFTSVGGDDDAIARALSTLDADWEHRVEVDDEAGDDWRAHAAPVWYASGRVTIPAWHDTTTFDDALTVTRVDPGSAFGLGDHPTTRTCMSLLADHLTRGDPQSDSLLDVGCGTGVLAVLAAQLGVAEIRAIDIADAAVEATRTNADLNQVAGRIDVDTTPLAQLDGGYDTIVANILAPVLVSMAPDLRRLLRPGGSLIVSGILADRHDHVLDALEPLGVVDTLSADGWISIVLR